MYGLATVTTVLVLFSLWPLRTIAHRLGLRSEGDQRLVVELETTGTIAHLLSAVERASAHVESVRVSEEAGRRTVEIVLAGETVTPDVVDEVTAVDGVATVEWAR
jgi:uncharacterized membrane protein YhiD involved in acid resistance